MTPHAAASRTTIRNIPPSTGIGVEADLADLGAFLPHSITRNFLKLGEWEVPLSRFYPSILRNPRYNPYLVCVERKRGCSDRT